MGASSPIVTPDRRVRVFVSSTLEELADERTAVRRAVSRLRLEPVMFEAGARTHPPAALYRAYLHQSDVFIGIYWQRYGWVAPDMTISGLEDEYNLSSDKPRLVYVKRADGRDDRLEALLHAIRDGGTVSYKLFSTPTELERLVCDDLAVLLTERFQATQVTAPNTRPRRSTPPADSTSFVDRTCELDEIVALLTGDSARCVTLTGPGGIGKTRLALQAARRLDRRFADGVCFVPLTAVEDAVGLAAAVAGALGLRDVGSESLMTVITDELSQLALLLVLDGFEHLVAGSGFVTEVLARAPATKVLVTSRSPLRVRAEHEIPVPPLAVPRRHATPEELGRSDATTLFVHRAAAVRHGFQADHDRQTVADICRRLDGIPLAIELAAAAVRLLPPKALLDHLDRRAALPVPAPRDVPDRHRTLRDAIASSYDLCTETERTLLARMAIFSGGCSLEAIGQICAPDGDVDVLTTAGSLVEKSLLATQAVGREIRFRMLETVRDFALARLIEGGEADDMAARHADYFRDLSVAIDRGIRGPKAAEWFARVADHGTGTGDADNIRTALRWYVSNRRGDDAATMVWSLWLVTWTLGSLAEGCSVAQAVLTEAGPMSDISRARVLSALGYLLAWKGDYRDALPVLNQAIELARRLHDDEAVGPALLLLGIITFPVDGEERGRELLRESLDVFAARLDPWGQAAALCALGWVAVALEDHHDHQLFADALAASERVGDVLLVAMCRNNAADHALALDDIDTTREHLGAALRGYRDLRAMYASAYGVETAANLVDHQGAPELAATLAGAADVIRERIGVTVYGSARGRRARFLRTLEEELGTERFRDARAAGRTLRYDGALDLAISAAAPPRPAAPARVLSAAR